MYRQCLVHYPLLTVSQVNLSRCFSGDEVKFEEMSSVWWRLPEDIQIDLSMSTPNSDSEPPFQTLNSSAYERKPTEFKHCRFASSAKRVAMAEHGFQSPAVY
ncbi:hypothetical protein C5167_048071 [Papaver somniferum]|uniref:Uncharacterized protein n=1 Tax=Papaver somniferum TaxID=3469 RepID=A0A4Y7KIA1_PAPSO|nr:hypothetical protein C5167_048071 [Papaver somniferum]